MNKRPDVTVISLSPSHQAMYSGEAAWLVKALRDKGFVAITGWLRGQANPSMIVLDPLQEVTDWKLTLTVAGINLDPDAQLIAAVPEMLRTGDPRPDQLRRRGFDVVIGHIGPWRPFDAATEIADILSRHTP